jgi:two-component system NtrC family sensor kinase
MKNIFANPEKSIAAKLIIATGLLIVILSFLFWFATLKKQEKDVMSIAVKYGASFVAFAEENTHRSMLTQDKAQTQQILENLSTPDGVQRVRIVNHKGNVVFSSKQEGVGKAVDRDSMTCMGCHTDPGIGTLSPNPKEWSAYKNDKGATSLKIISKISNETSCSSASCHVHPEGQDILGFVEADLSLALLDEALFKQGLALTAYVVIFVIVVSMFLGIINYKIVTHPVQKLSEGMEKVAGGDLDHSVHIDSIDEIGVLANTFNSMINDLKAAAEQKERWTQTLEEEIAKKTRHHSR